MAGKQFELGRTSPQAKYDQDKLIELIRESDRYFGNRIIRRMDPSELEEILKSELLFVKMEAISKMKDPLEKDARNQFMNGLIGNFLDRVGFGTNEYVGPDKNNLLLWAIICENIPLAHRLIEAGMRLDGENIHGQTSLDASVTINNIDLFKRLCFRGLGIHRFIDPYIKLNEHIEAVKSRPDYEDQLFDCHNRVFDVFRNELSHQLKNASSKQLASAIGTYPVVPKENQENHFSVTLKDDEIHLRGCSFRYALVLLPIRLHEEIDSFEVANCDVPLKTLPSIHNTRRPGGKQIPDMGLGESRGQNYLGVDPGWLFNCRPEKSSVFKFQVEDHKEDFDFVAIALLRYTVSSEQENFCKQRGAVHHESYIHLSHPYCTTPGRHGTYMNLTKPETCKYQESEERRVAAERERKKQQQINAIRQRHVYGGNQILVKEEPEDDYEVPTGQASVDCHDHMESRYIRNHHRRNDRREDVSPHWNRTHENRNRWAADHQEGPSTGRPHKRPHGNERRGNQREVKEEPEDDYEVTTRRTPVQRHRQMERSHNPDHQRRNRHQDASPPRNRTREYRDRFANDHQEGPSTGPVRRWDGNRYQNHSDERYQRSQHKRNYDEQYRRRDNRYNKPEHKRR